MEILKKLAALGISRGEPSDVTFYSTGIKELDYLINPKGGGIPKGRITEAFGEYSSGKTALAYSIIGSAQKAGKTCMFANVEGTMDLSFATKLFGVVPEDLLVLTCDTAEDYLKGIEKVIEEKAADVIIVDSLEALVPSAEKEAEYGDALMGIRARLLSRFFRRTVAEISKSDIALVFLNQSRIDFMHGQEFSPGGKALKFYASLRLHLKKRSKLVESNEVTGTQTLVKVEKNKCGQPFGELLIDFKWKLGFDATSDTIGLALGAGILEKRGNTFYFGEQKLGVGLPATKAYFLTHKEVFEEIKSKL